MWDETAGDMQVIWVKRERKYFLMEDWTTQIRLICLKKFLFSSTRFARYATVVDAICQRRSVRCPS
jgi:hypothetical protein